MPMTSDRSHPNWTGDCLHCGGAFSLYLRPSRTPPRFCSLNCSNNWPPHILACTKYGDENARWLGDKAKPQSGRKRAAKRFSPVRCEDCGKKKAERHHIDGNTLNNDPSNIKFLCKSCHQIEDGRQNAAIHFFKLNPRRGEQNCKAKLKDADIPAIRRRIANGETQARIAADYGVGEEAIGFIHRGKSWKHVPITQAGRDYYAEQTRGE